VTPLTVSRRLEHPEPGSHIALRVLRGLSGAVAAGLVVLAGATAVAAWFTDREGAPGPGTDIALGHVAIAVLAVAAQVVADRSSGRPVRALLAALVVLGLAGAALWVWWWN
jgi:predicted ribosomally synthesized peptide with SipW-like signal peptide